MQSVENAFCFGGKNDTQNFSESFGHQVKTSQNIPKSVDNTGRAGSNFYGQNVTKVPPKMTEYSGARNVDKNSFSQIDKSASRNVNTSNHFGVDTPKRIVSKHFVNKNYADKHVSNYVDNNVDVTMCDDNDVSCLEIPCVTPGGSGTGRTSQLKSVSQVPAPYDKVICMTIILFTLGI